VRRRPRCCRRRYDEAVSDAAQGKRRATAGGNRVGAAAVVAVGRPACRAKAGVSAAPAAATLGKGEKRTLWGLFEAFSRALACAARPVSLWDVSQIATDGGLHEAGAHVGCDVQKHGCQCCEWPRRELLSEHMTPLPATAHRKHILHRIEFRTA